jgi:hypothetical protein
MVEAPSRLEAGMRALGCADAGLYRLLHDAELSQVQMFPQWVIYTVGSYLQTQRSKLPMNLAPEDTRDCREALARSGAAGTFLMAEPFHCAVGIKR